MTSLSNLDERQSQLVSTNLKECFDTKKIHFYENERWYLTLGFVPTNLERPHYSDGTG